MCVKISFGDLNLGPYLPHPTNTYTHEITISPRMRSGVIILILFKISE